VINLFFEIKSSLQAPVTNAILKALDLTRDRSSLAQSKGLRQIAFQDLQTMEGTESSTTIGFKKILIKIS